MFTCIPLNAKETLVLGKWLVHKDAVEGVDYDLANLVRLWDATNLEDRDLCELNQRGVNSPGYTPGPYSAVAESLVLRFVNYYVTQAKAVHRGGRGPGSAHPCPRGRIVADPAIWRGGDDLLRCTAISDEAPGVKTFRFASSSGAPIRFHAGQFVTLQLPLSGGDVWRCFTIASSPLRDEAIDLTIKTQASAGTINTSGTRLDAPRACRRDDAPGHAARWSILPDASAGDTAAARPRPGSGATPMASIARWLRDIGCRTPVHYVHLARTPSRLAVSRPRSSR